MKKPTIAILVSAGLVVLGSILFEFGLPHIGITLMTLGILGIILGPLAVSF